jgi:hypothetical protein
MKRAYLYGAIVVAVVVVAGVAAAVLVTRGSTGGDGGATVGRGQDAFARELQKRLGADSCSNSGFALENGTDGSREVVYDCVFGSRRRCIAVDQGIARDATADVRRLFANMGSSAHAGCAGI